MIKQTAGGKGCTPIHVAPQGKRPTSGPNGEPANDGVCDKAPSGAPSRVGCCHIGMPTHRRTRQRAGVQVEGSAGWHTTHWVCRAGAAAAARGSGQTSQVRRQLRPQQLRLRLLVLLLALLNWCLTLHLLLQCGDRGKHRSMAFKHFPDDLGPQWLQPFLCNYYFSSQSI